jgi:hypothetical protein
METQTLSVEARAAMLRRRLSAERTAQARRLPYGLRPERAALYDGGEARRMLRALQDALPDEGLALVARGSRTLHPFRTWYPPPRSRRTRTYGPMFDCALGCVLRPTARLAVALQRAKDRVAQLPRSARGGTRRAAVAEVRRLTAACALLNGERTYPEPMRLQRLPLPNGVAPRPVLQRDYVGWCGVQDLPPAPPPTSWTGAAG